MFSLSFSRFVRSAAMAAATSLTFSQIALAKGETLKFKIDPDHTAVVFKVSHLGFSPTYGQFTGVEGQFTIDESKPEKTSFEIVIKTDSVNTHNEKRDKHLRSPDFFNAKQNPKITIQSTSVKKVAEGKYDVAANLSLNGVTKPVSFQFLRSRTGKDPWGSTRTGGETKLTIKRSDFNMNFMQGENQISDEVELFVGVEGIQQ